MLCLEILFCYISYVNTVLVCSDVNGLSFKLSVTWKQFCKVLGAHQCLSLTTKMTDAA